jgi:hypothetical protein
MATIGGQISPSNPIRYPDESSWTNLFQIFTNLWFNARISQQGGNVPCDNECETTYYRVLLHTNLLNIFYKENASDHFMNNLSHLKTMYEIVFVLYNM